MSDSTAPPIPSGSAPGGPPPSGADSGVTPPAPPQRPSEQRRPAPKPQSDDLIRRVAEASSPDQIDPEDSADATAWFLGADPEDTEPATGVLELNVGSTDEPRWIPWEIQAVGEDELTRINRMASSRAQRRGRAAQADGGEQQAMTNARIVAVGTIDPPIGELAAQMQVADPAVAVRLRFKKKPGLLLQLAGAILSLSGYDDEDVREAREVKAAGNS